MQEQLEEATRANTSLAMEHDSGTSNADTNAQAAVKERLAAYAREMAIREEAARDRKIVQAQREALLLAKDTF